MSPYVGQCCWGPAGSEATVFVGRCRMGVSLVTLDTGDFNAFFEALNGYPPFPWQRELATRAAQGEGSNGGWPEVIAIPTGCGKTVVIDIAVFALACQAYRPAGERTAPRRIFFTVDRRVIVDEAYNRAVRLAQALQQAETGILAEIAARLRHLSGGGLPLECYELRGGIYRDDGWARTPTQLVVIATTVDQLGSRLLFRTYGRSPRMWSLQAGLAANDSLILLDEAHCSVPFRQTVSSIARYRGRQWAKRPLSTPFVFVEMTATPALERSALVLSQEDLKNPELRRRVHARKPVRLVDPVRGKSGSKEMVHTLCREAEALAKEGAKRLAIIVNRVETARDVYRELQVDEERKVLLIGRMRPLDRDGLMKRWGPYLKSDPNRKEIEKPLFIVATQCLEVGADLDFDAMVSECASFDALRQRFGRLNRLGREQNACGVIVVAEKDLDDRAKDFIYGTSLKDTWSWLEQHARKTPEGEKIIDFGIAFMDELWRRETSESASRLLAPSPNAPVMLPAHIDAWVQTSPFPTPDPDVALFLHGPDRGTPEVRVCWRADLDPQAVEQWGREAAEAAWIEVLMLCPPAASECMSVPLYAVRSYLEGSTESPPISDVEAGVPEEEDKGRKDAKLGRPVLCWRGADDSHLLVDVRELSEVRRGDVLVFPISNEERRLLEAPSGDSKGVSFSWEVLGHVPQEHGRPPVIDWGDQANALTREKAVLRVHPETVVAWPECSARERLLELARMDDLPQRIGEPELQEELHECLRELAASAQAPEYLWLKRTAEYFARSPRLQEEFHPCGWRLSSDESPTDAEVQKITGGLVLWAPGRMKMRQSLPDTWEEEDSIFSAGPVLLKDHCARVAWRVRDFAAECGLSQDLTQALELAAWFHDVGKADPRFQVLLRGGNAAAGERYILAKSSGAPRTPRAQRWIRRQSGYPQGARHELLSVRLFESISEKIAEEEKVADLELVYHLIASHHGYCRPFAPVVVDETPQEVRLEYEGYVLEAFTDTGLEHLDGGVPERFWRLVRRYGWWGLAFLESLLMLADHRVSEEEESLAYDPQKTGRVGP